MNAQQLYNALVRYEVAQASPNDGRQVIRDERLRLHVAMASHDPARIGAQMREAERVARMWGVKLP